MHAMVLTAPDVPLQFQEREDPVPGPGAVRIKVSVGLIGWRSLVMAGEGKQLGIYGFCAAGHIVAQAARWQGRSVHAFTRAGDIEAQRLAKSLGTDWVGGSEQMPPVRLDAAIIYAPVGALVLLALRAVRKGGRVICAAGAAVLQP
jgi:propanol-preferring alcohol dehydrogenase